MKPFLTAQEVIVLQEVHHAARRKRYADRIKTILLLNEGMSYGDIARILLLDDSTLRDYYQQYKTHGLDHLVEDNYQGSVAKLTLVQQQTLTNHLQQTLYHQIKDVVVYVQKTYGSTYSIAGMTHLLHDLGFVYKKTKVIPGKVDVAKQAAFITAYEELKAGLGEDDIIYFTDGSHPQHNVQASYGWIMKGEDKEVRSNTGRQRINLLGALDINDMEILVTQEPTINAQAMIKLCDTLEAKHPKGTIYVIADNAKYNRAKLVQQRLVNSRITMVYLPPYSPNCNIIERLWWFYHRKVLYDQYYETYEQFKTVTKDFFTNILQYEDELRSLLTDNFQVIGVTG